jgi:hypothetical protein
MSKKLFVYIISIAEYIFFSSAHGTSSRVDHTSSYSKNLKKY